MPPRRASREEQLNAEFVGSNFSNQELEFLLDHLGEPPEVAFPDGEEPPVGVNPAAIEPLLDKTYRLEQLAKAAADRGIQGKFWVGFDALRDLCQKTLDWNATVAELKTRVSASDGPIKRAAGAPSLHMWDPDTDVPYLGGIGADGDTVRTALGDHGQRIPLHTFLRDVGAGAIKELGGVAAFLKSSAKKTPKGQAKATEPKAEKPVPNALVTTLGETTATLSCPICGHTEVFEPNKPSTKRAAERAVMAHVKTAKTKKDAHHAFALRLSSGKAGRKQAEPEPEVEDNGSDEASED